jgi:hypothetical protein
MNSRDKRVGNSHDFVFCFELGNLNKEDIIYDKPLVEMIRQQIKNLLEVVSFAKKGEEVNIDGFKLLCDKNSIYSLFPWNVDNEQMK